MLSFFLSGQSLFSIFDFSHCSAFEAPLLFYLCCILEIMLPVNIILAAINVSSKLNLAKQISGV